MKESGIASVIEIGLPAGWDNGIAPTVYSSDPTEDNYNLPTAAEAKTMTGYVYLNRPVTANLRNAVIEVINSAGAVNEAVSDDGSTNNPDRTGWFIRIKFDRLTCPKIEKLFFTIKTQGHREV